jgi:hypothetical protein
MTGGGQKSAWALDVRGRRRGKMDGQTSLNRFQAHRKWEISAHEYWCVSLQHAVCELPFRHGCKADT